MPTAIEKRLNAIERMLKELSGRIEQRPVVQTVQKAHQLYVIIDKGNTLEGGQFGIKHLNTEIASLPSAYDPNVTSSFIDGIGRGTLVRDGSIVPGYVLVCNDMRSLWAHAFLQLDAAAITGTAIISNGSGFSTVYIPV